MKRILVLGYFGYINNQLDGQTIKTRNIYELFQLKLSDKNNIEIFDTQLFKYSKFAIINMIWKISRCNKLVYLPAHNNLKYLFPIIYFLCWIKRAEILYFVVGGWLAEFLKHKRFHVKLLSNIRSILTESNELSNSLTKQYQFKNVITFPNFRIHSFNPTFIQNKDQFKIVFMARIMREKGIDYVFQLANYYSTKIPNNASVIIDFYGPIAKEDEEYFKQQVEKYDIISYKGTLQPDEIYKTLNNYDLLVLPTSYPGEGFPGTILDAYISGIPVVVSDWKFLSEFVDHGKSGYLFDLEKADEFYYYVEKLHCDNNLLMQMKYNAHKYSEKFSSEKAWDILLKNN
jgi:glycosyltransferase involved in cell wall biosynthesis